MQYFIHIADISILADVPYYLNSSDSTHDFIFPVSGTIKEDLRFKIIPVEKLPDRMDVRFKENRRVYVGSGADAGTFFSSYPGSKPYAFVSRHSVHEGNLFCEYIPGNEKYIDYARNLFNLMDIEATLLDFDAVILHASFIRYSGYGIVFTAPSGTGKSTQAELWQRYEGAEVLNGDRAALRQIGSQWRAYGLPYAGTSGIYRNESAPLRAIVVLKQAKENKIRLLRGSEAFRYLYPETLIHRWDEEFEHHATDLLLSILKDVPVFLLECMPNKEAVSLLHDTLKEFNESKQGNLIYDPNTS